MSQLTRPQAVILRTALQNDPAISGQIGIADQPILDYLNAATTFKVWRTTTPVADIQDQVVWANFTPSNPTAAPDVLSANNTLNWLLACQGKQFNLQNLLSAGNSGGIATGKPNIRAGLQDACSQIPSGTAGVSRTGGWAGGIQLIIQRAATKAEQLLATGTGTQANPGDLVFDGIINGSDLYIILNRDGLG